jgi:RNA polymerase sigma factor (sigma-70 family)
MTDKEKLFKLKTDESYFTQIYNDHKGYTMRFLTKMNNDSDLLSDLYQDAMIVLCQKVKDPSFQLTCSIQTYINSICRNQLLNKFKESSRYISKGDDFDPEITDWFEDEFDQEKESRISLIEKALEHLRENGEKCFEILNRFFYQRQSMDEIAVEMQYTNGDNVKNQKSRCQKKLKELVLNGYGAI